MHPYINKTFRITPTKYEPGKGLVDLEPVTGVCVSFDPDKGIGQYRLPDGSHVGATAINTVLLHAEDGYPKGYVDALEDVLVYLESVGGTGTDVAMWCESHAEKVRAAMKKEE